MKNGINDNEVKVTESFVTDIGLETRTNALLKKLDDVLYERSLGLNCATVIGVLDLLKDKFKKDQGF